MTNTVESKAEVILYAVFDALPSSWAETAELEEVAARITEKIVDILRNQGGEMMSHEPTTIFTEDVYLGTRKEDGVRITLYAPSWDCDWYWGFGYLGNENEHFHLSGLASGGNRNLYDALREDYELNTALSEGRGLWLFCELMTTAYKLKEASELFYRGGSHYCMNPLRDLLLNNNMYEEINYTLIPSVLDEVYKLFDTGSHKKGL